MADDDEQRHLIWAAEQARIAQKREQARALLDGDPSARRLLEGRWAPLSKTDPTA